MGELAEVQVGDEESFAISFLQEQILRLFLSQSQIPHDEFERAAKDPANTLKYYSRRDVTELFKKGVLVRNNGHVELGARVHLLGFMNRAGI